MASPLKAPTSIQEQIAIMRSRGMDVDEKLAEQWLTSVGYYRLSAYSYPARVLASNRRREHFRDGTTFKSVVELYEADRKLRTLVHDGIERIEILMRTRLGAATCSKYADGYKQKSHYHDLFDRSKWLRIADGRIERARERHPAVKHYQEKYGGQYPFWVLAEVLDFADISKLFEGLLPSHKRKISKELGLTIAVEQLSKNQRKKIASKPPLARWLEQLTVVRNTCAHHSRLWNIGLIPAPTNALRTLPRFAYLPEGQSEKLYGALCMMTHLVLQASPNSAWPAKVTSLISKNFLPNPLVSKSAIGLPEDWDGNL